MLLRTVEKPDKQQTAVFFREYATSELEPRQNMKHYITEQYITLWILQGKNVEEYVTCRIQNKHNGCISRFQPIDHSFDAST